jgi:hypothetical protein
MFFNFLHSLSLCNFQCFYHSCKSLQFFKCTLFTCIATHITNHKVVMEQLRMQKNSMTIFSSSFSFEATCCFCINFSFFQAPHSFHDGLVLVHPHGSNYCPSMVQMHYNILHSSKCHHHHLFLYFSIDSAKPYSTIEFLT